MRSDYGDALKDGVRGKYLEAALAAKGLARIEPDLREAFPDSDSINRALRSLLEDQRQPKTSKP